MTTYVVSTHYLKVTRLTMTGVQRPRMLLVVIITCDDGGVAVRTTLLRERVVE